MSARDIVLENLKGFLGGPPDDIADQGREIMILHYLEGFAGCSAGDVRPLQRDGLGIRILEDSARLTTLLEVAQTDAIAFDVCSELVLHACFHDMPLPEDLARFAYDVMNGKKSRRGSKGRSGQKTCGGIQESSWQSAMPCMRTPL